MRIDYPKRSSFLKDCEKTILQKKDALLRGDTISIEFSSKKGYNGDICVNIDRENNIFFHSDWESTDLTRFPVRIKAAAYALFMQDCFGKFAISHNKGILTIRYQADKIELNT